MSATDDAEQALQRLEDAAGRDADEGGLDFVTTQTLQELDENIQTALGDKTALEIEQELGLVEQSEAPVPKNGKTDSG